MRFVIIGAGAVGSAIGGFLSQSHEVLLVGRGEHAAGMAGGLRITGILGEFDLRPESTTPAELVSHSFLQHPIDWILLTVKSSALIEAAELAASIAGSETGICHIQNGLGNFETVSRIFPAHLVVSGMTITGYEIVRPGEIGITVYGGPGKIGCMPLVNDRFGPVANQQARQLAEFLNATPLVFEYSEDIQSFLWAKLLYNCCLNPLGALLRVPYGKLLDSQCLSIMRSVLDEAFALADAMNVSLFWPGPDAYFEHLIGTLIPATAGHEPSMLADLNRSRPTEIDAMNGYIVARSEELGLEAPVNRILTNLIKASLALQPKKT